MDRKHFHPMMTPQPADFDQLQGNSEKAINSLASGLGGGSILEGLSVSLQPSTLLVEAGKAIDEQGRLLILEKQTSMTLDRGYLGLRYKQDTTSATVWTGETHWQEKFDKCELYWSTTQPTVCLGQRLSDGTFSLNVRSLRHSDRLNNPHNVTSDQISTSSYLTATDGSSKKWNLQQWLTHLLGWTKSYKLHAEDKENPHNVTADQIATSETLTNTTGKKQTWSLQSWITHLLDWTKAHQDNKSNPHNVTKAQVGLGNLPNNLSDSYTPQYDNNDKLIDTLATSEAVNKSHQNLTTQINELRPPWNATKIWHGTLPGNLAWDIDKTFTLNNNHHWQHFRFILALISAAGRDDDKGKWQYGKLSKYYYLQSYIIPCEYLVTANYIRDQYNRFAGIFWNDAQSSLIFTSSNTFTFKEEDDNRLIAIYGIK